MRHFLSLLLSVRPSDCLFVYLSVCLYASTSLCSASYVTCKCGTTRICCCAPCCRPAPAVQQSTRLAHSNKPAARCCSRRIGQTDGQTDGRTLHRYINPAAHTMRAVPITSADGFTNTGAMLAFISFPFIEN